MPDQGAAQLGSDIFGDQGRFGQYFTRLREKGVEERVNKWKETYKNLSNWQLIDLLKTPTVKKDTDMVRAIFYLLADTGFFELDR